MVSIWIVLFLFVESAWADVYTQDVSVSFRSTSILMETGSTLPLAVRDGPVTTMSDPFPISQCGIVSLYPDDGETDEDGGNIDTNVKDPKEVNDSPMEDLSLVEILIFAGLFTLGAYRRRRRISA